MSYKLYDLSVPVGFMSPWYMGWRGGRPDRFLERYARHESGILAGVHRRVSVYNVSHWHIGTHNDGETHNVEGGETCDQIPLERCYGTGVVLDMRYKKKWEDITPTDFEKNPLKVKKEDFVVINTGWHHYYGKDGYAYYNYYPALGVKGAQYLVDRGVKAVAGTWGALDGPLAHRPLKSDYPWLYDEYTQTTGKDPDIEYPVYEPVHEILCSNKIHAIENAGGDVDLVTGKRCTLCAFPFKYADTGHMLRLVAIVED